MGKILNKALLYAMILMLGDITFGYVLVYPSPAIPSMQETMSSISELEYTIYRSGPALSAVFGPYITLLLLKYTGRKPTTFIVSVAGTIFWLMLIVTYEQIFWYGIIVRLFLGLVMGGFSQIIPMYIVELAPPEATGFYGSLGQLAIASGIVILYLVGTYLDWQNTAIVGACITGLLSFLIWLVPESPAVAEAHSSITPTESIFQRRFAKPLIICVLLMFFQQFSGVNGILTNLTTLFNNAGIEIESGIASTISSLAQVISVFCGGFVIEFLGRKFAWVVSLIGISVSLALFCLSIKVTLPSWLPILIVFLFLLFFGLGAGPLPWFFVNELIETSARAQASSIVASSNWICAFLVIAIFPSMQSALGDFWCFMIFMIISVVGAVFGLLFLQQKVDKSQEQLINTQLMSNN
ncbi:major facilitator superfamily transporter [Histomonas meleagridis]|uniref:major facilitator superfamily transporter n=1 Tax=Histomonas meleagridis TaxID=135588 RepID=UPI00355A23F7|nr:major facilitator superfamily transporter [Histomonas meleagridis]KAH0801617.1 major facilitator superfamily transporter [Histomonas meleagridis]